MDQVILRVKKLVPNAVIPKKAFSTDTGFDLVAVSVTYNGQYIEYGTGLAIMLPLGWAAQIRARSSISKYDLILCNGVGTIDGSYRGELKLRFKKTRESASNVVYDIGDKIGQLVLEQVPPCVIEEVAELDVSARGSGGFGSSGA